MIGRIIAAAACIAVLGCPTRAETIRDGAPNPAAARRDGNGLAPAAGRLPPPGTARWLVRAWRTGGIAGIRQFVSIDADGRLEMTDWRANPRCAAEVPKERLAEIEAALERSTPENWRRSYAPPDNPDGCCDQTGHTLYVERNDSKAARRTHETTWFVDAKLVPGTILSLYEMIWSASKGCAVVG